VTLTIVDINDHDPVFLSDTPPVIEIMESAQTGSRFALPAATDADSSRYGIQRYAFASDGDTETPFELQAEAKPDGSSDVRLVLVEALDRESRAEYQLTVVAYDGGEEPAARSASIEIHVVVLDVNDNRPTFEHDYYEAVVPENVPTGSIVLRVRASDPDEGANGDIRYRLDEQFHDLFAVDDVTGDVIVVGALDYERATSYHLTVSAVDGGSSTPEAVMAALTADVAVRVRLDDVNDNRPEVVVNTLATSGAKVAEVAEQARVGTFVGHVIVSDADSGRNARTDCKLVPDREDFDSAFRLEQMFDNEYKVIYSFSLYVECNFPLYNVLRYTYTESSDNFHLLRNFL